MKIVAHRGGMGLGNANSLEVIQNSLNYQIDLIEIDLRVTKDLVVALNHDRGIMTPSCRLDIAKSSFQELKSAMPDLVTLDQVLKRVNKSSRFYLEIKPDQPLEPIASALERALASGWRKDQLILGSFDYSRLAGLKQLCPGFEFIVIESWLIPRALLSAKRLDTKNLALNHKVLFPGLVKFLHSRGYHVYAYTINDKKRAKKLETAGLSGLITDYPDRFAKLIK